MESKGQWNKAAVMEAEASVATAFMEDGSAPQVPVHISYMPTHDITHTRIYILTLKFHLHEILLEKQLNQVAHIYIQGSSLQYCF